MVFVGYLICLDLAGCGAGGSLSVCICRASETAGQYHNDPLRVCALDHASCVLLPFQSPDRGLVHVARHSHLFGYQLHMPVLDSFRLDAAFCIQQPTHMWYGSYYGLVSVIMAPWESDMGIRTMAHIFVKDVPSGT